MSNTTSADCDVLFDVVLRAMTGTGIDLNKALCCNSPSYICSEGKVTQINLSSKGLTGDISPQLIQLNKLEILDLSSNRFIGTLPPFLGQLNQLRKLDVSSNEFSGDVPASLASMKSLEELDISTNGRFNTPLPQALLLLAEKDPKKFRLGSYATKPAVTSVGSTESVTGIYPTVSTTPTIGSSANSDAPNQTLLVVLTSLIVIVMICIGLGVAYFLWRKKVAEDESDELEANEKENQSPFGLLQVPRFEIANFPRTTSTDFAETTIVSENTLSRRPTKVSDLMYDMRLVIQQKLIGSGGSGNVYKSTYGGIPSVAKIPIDLEHRTLLYTESQIMASLDSPYLIKYLGLVVDAPIDIPNEPKQVRTALLLEFMNFGSFAQYLDPTFPEDRAVEQDLVLGMTLKLLIQSAKGLEYMHGLGLVHLDIKPNNILLHMDDDGELVAKISDFGSTLKEGSTESVFQTPGFIPPEAKTNKKKTCKYDIFAFGFTIINIITRTNFAFMWEGSGKTLEAKKKFLSQHIHNISLLELIMSCIDDNPTSRPSIKMIIKKLSVLKQEDFNITILNQRDSFSTENRSLQSRTFAYNTNYLTNNSLSGLYKNSPGRYLLDSLSLKSPVDYQTFLTAFQSTYVKELETFDEQKFRAKVKPINNQVTFNMINNHMLKDVPSLDFNEDEEVWTSTVTDGIDYVVYKCKRD
ncbi:kinase-like domain-containing protein [Globomyces pollinis-pini]|nr:kinase-like domain-containing protein [Globomyces pollinis-pini]